MLDACCVRNPDCRRSIHGIAGDARPFQFVYLNANPTQSAHCPLRCQTETPHPSRRMITTAARRCGTS